MALAYKSSCQPISETKLNYGPCKRPQNQQRKDCHPRIPEEKLYNCGKTIIELKRKNCQPNCDEDDYSNESEEEPCYDDNPSQSQPCYKDIGYGPVQTKYCKFVPCTKEESHEQCQSFTPGRVIYTTCEKPASDCAPTCHHYHHHHHHNIDNDNDDSSSEEQYTRGPQAQRIPIYQRPSRY